MEFNWEEVDKIDGWLFKEEAELLYGLACGIGKQGLWVEIGSWKGKSTVAMAQSGNYGIAIDWFKGSQETPNSDTEGEFELNVRPYRKMITAVKFRSEDPIAVAFVPDMELLFIDGDHSYEGAKRDFDLYSPKVVQGGHLVLHDAWGELAEEDVTPWPGVTKLAKEIREMKEWTEVGKVRRCAVFRKL